MPEAICKECGTKMEWSEDESRPECVACKGIYDMREEDERDDGRHEV